MRRTMVAGNWKMHGTRASVAELIDDDAEVEEEDEEAALARAIAAEQQEMDA